MSDNYSPKLRRYETPRTEFATGNLMRSTFAFKKYGQNAFT